MSFSFTFSIVYCYLLEGFLQILLSLIQLLFISPFQAVLMNKGASGLAPESHRSKIAPLSSSNKVNHFLFFSLSKVSLLQAAAHVGSLAPTSFIQPSSPGTVTMRKSSYSRPESRLLPTKSSYKRGIVGLHC